MPLMIKVNELFIYLTININVHSYVYSVNELVLIYLYDLYYVCLWRGRTII